MMQRQRRTRAGNRLVRTATLGAFLVVAPLTTGCTTEGGIEHKGSLRIVVTDVGGAGLPSPGAPLAPNLGDRVEQWRFTVEALDENFRRDTSLNGFVRISVRPGSVERVLASGVWPAEGRNIRLEGGYAEGIAEVTAVFGPSRLWVEDLGYEPAPLGIVPACANGIDDDGDVLVDHPNDPGCQFADDMTEEGGTFETGVSPSVAYARPSLAEVQGQGSQTPYPFVALQVDTGDLYDPASRYVVVTRVASNGFFVTDRTDDATGFNHMYAYNFNLPGGMRVCDRVTYLSGTVSEFYGFTELSFPSYVVHYRDQQGNIFGPADCRVPEPRVLDAATIAVPLEMERQESGLVRIENFQVATKIGPELAINNSFAENRSNCDLNQDGTVDYLDDAESSCSDACADDPGCSEWSGYEARGNYKVFSGGTMILVNTSSAFGFDPLAHKGATLGAVTGTLRNFSGGKLNWTIEIRCEDDLVCTLPGCPLDCDAAGNNCVPRTAPVPINTACVTFHTEIDDDVGTY